MLGDQNDKILLKTAWYFLTFSKLANGTTHLADMSAAAVAVQVCVADRADRGW